ncbi:hypothetical protein [Methylobacterium frigidaeris]|uniref:hypothetical protein n=1 Tax=Methylobacterium frigidaeris TaxID=2038277 RepID=UPI0010562327|nr:hypothetical protein [Methylobacterium frigidaeris]
MRLLRAIIEKHGLDIVPAPDGTVRFAFKADVSFLDRLAMWGSSVEDLEGLDDDDEDGGDQETPEYREAAPPAAPPETGCAPLTALSLGVPQEMAAVVRDLYAA